MHITRQGIIFEFPTDYPQVLQESIKQVYETCSKKSDFPDDACWWTSSRLKSIGLPQKFGYFLLDTPIVEDRGVREFHNWNVDLKDRVIDLTVAQMNKGLNEKVLGSIVIVDSGTELYKRFLVANTQFSWEK